jgi:hypothetical protein
MFPGRLSGCDPAVFVLLQIWHVSAPFRCLERCDTPGKKMRIHRIIYTAKRGLPAEIYVPKISVSALLFRGPFSVLSLDQPALPPALDGHLSARSAISENRFLTVPST